MEQRNTSTRRRPQWWTAVACGAELVIIGLMTWPFWGDAIRGVFIYATPMSIALYGFLFLTACVLLLAAVGLVPLPRSMLLAAAVAAPLVLLAKWIAIGLGGWELFHNRMGLGMEILGHIPNLVIDAAILVSSLVVALAVFRGVRRST